MTLQFFWCAFYLKGYVIEKIMQYSEEMINDLLQISDYTPAVFAVKDSYQIMLPVHTPCTFWVRVGDIEYYDDSNGILRSDTPIHRVSVPVEELDRAGGYTVYWQIVEERKPYFPRMKPVAEQTFRFRPLPENEIRIYQIADAHGRGESAIADAEFFVREKGGLDLLILNGDVIDHGGKTENFMIYYEIATALTKGEFPVIVSRGNHDLRGQAAEKLADFTPGENGNSYYSFRLGSLWGMVLDCGEDKIDGHPEYGNTVRCHAFRERENEYFKSIVANAKNEYAADGVKHRIVVSHVPFNHINVAPFDIEQAMYKEWVERLNRDVKPDLMLCGHIHDAFITMPGDAYSDFDTKFPVVVGSKTDFDRQYYVGCGVVLKDDEIEVSFNDVQSFINETHLPFVK